METDVTGRALAAVAAMRASAARARPGEYGRIPAERACARAVPALADVAEAAARALPVMWAAVAFMPVVGPGNVAPDDSAEAMNDAAVALSAALARLAGATP